MSRGLGQLQQRILAELRNSGSTLETLRWSLWDETGSVAGKLPQTWNTSVTRAVETLEDRRDIMIDSRPLASLEEWVKHYPGKSLYIQVRKLRFELLPHLVSWLTEGDGPAPRFSRSQNEEFVREQLDTDPDQVRRFSAKWARFEPAIRTCYAHSGCDELFLLLARGKQLFGPRFVRTKIAFRDLLDRCEPHLTRELQDELRGFLAEFLPSNSAGALNLRSYVRSIAKDVPVHGHCELSDAAIDALYARCEDTISRLPGFQPPQPPAKLGRFWIGDTNRPHHSPLIKKILDHSVFQRFRFLTIR
jgi:hypothetical protein